jgi:hypothetical protein
VEIGLDLNGCLSFGYAEKNLLISFFVTFCSVFITNIIESAAGSVCRY